MFKSILLVLGLIILSALLLGCASNLSMIGVGIRLTPTSLYISQSNLIPYKINLIGHGLAKLKNTKIELEHFFIQKDTGEILEKEKEIVFLKGEVSFTRDFEIPLGIPAGDYKLAAVARTKGITSSNYFEIEID